MSPLSADKSSRIVIIEMWGWRNCFAIYNRQPYSGDKMDFKKKIDIRVALAKIAFTLTVASFVTIICSFIYHNLSPFANLITALIPLDLLSKQKTCLFNSYLFLNYRGKEPSPTKDIPIKPQDIECYNLNNPFPALNNVCNSGKNITLFLKNNKKVIFSVKDQEFYIVNWLKENFIRKEDKILILGRVETALCLLVTLLEFLFFFNLYKSGNMSKYCTAYLITSAACFAYWVIYILSGIAISKRS